MPALVAGQNEDGGWGAVPKGVSWTEPTAWSLLALHGAKGAPAAAVSRGIAWLRRSQLESGGWAAGPGVGGESWVSALVSLLGPEALGRSEHTRALEAVQRGAEQPPTRTELVRQWMLGRKPAAGPPARGWAWVPGTASWLMPTAISMLTLRKYGVGAAETLTAARNYLVARQCADGGWNHGSSRALGYDGVSYPETTGLALVALRSEKGTEVERALQAAERQAQRCQTYEGACWLRLALYVHGREAVFAPPAGAKPDHREMALTVIVERSMAGEGLLWRS